MIDVGIKENNSCAKLIESKISAVFSKVFIFPHSFFILFVNTLDTVYRNEMNIIENYGLVYDFCTSIFKVPIWLSSLSVEFRVRLRNFPMFLLLKDFTLMVY